MSREDYFWGCVEAFATGDYDGCAQRAWELAQGWPTLHVLQLLLIGLQRIGREDMIEVFGPQALAAAAAFPWEHALLRLTLGQADPAEVLRQAADDVQRCQTLYYTGARLLTLRPVEQAQQNPLRVCCPGM